MLYYSIPCSAFAVHDFSALCLYSTHHRLSGLFPCITLLSYASPKQINTQLFHTFALPIITTISHAVDYFVISVQLKRKGEA
jgi:hypothetical protein